MLHRSFCLIFFLLISMSVRAQDDSLKRIMQKFDAYLNHAYQEKIYLHTDRTFYLTGDFLWFKAYVVDGIKHRPSDMSKVSYVEILDGNNAPVLQAKIELKDGNGNGAIFLPASLNSGNYVLRAYTKWMQNFSPEVYFHKTVTIVNPFKPLPQVERQADQRFDAQYFPEGGNLIEGIESKIAFRVVDQNGHGISFKGLVIDQDYDTVASFSPLKFGIGNFTFVPKSGKQYRAIIKDDANNILSIKDLMKPAQNGYGLRLQDEGDKITINVYSRFDDDELKIVHLLMHAHGQVVTASTKALHQSSGTFVVNRNDIPGGTSHITVFDQLGQPVCERLYFKKAEQTFQLDGNVNKSTFALREKTVVNISATKGSSGIQTDLSASVYRLDSLQTEDPMSMTNYLALTSELTGNVESPDFYFSNDSEVRQATDNLMLTHGWRRFTWRDVLSKKKEFSFVPEYRAHLVTGSIENIDTGEPAVNIPVYLSIPGKKFQLRGTKSDRSGEIKFELKEFYGPGKMIVQTNTQVDSVYQIKISNPFSDKFAEATTVPLNLSKKIAEQLIGRSTGMQLENAYFEQLRGRIIPPALDTIPFYGKPDEHYRLDDFTRFPVMEEVMREYVPGILVRKRKDDFYFITLNDNNNSVFRENPLVMLDGIPIFRINTIMEYDPAKVESLDVITKKYFYGPLSFPGVASYFTYNGDYPDLIIDERALVLDYEGMLWQREFFSPVYETKEEQLSRLPDARNLLYWSPHVSTDSEGKGKIEFYASDQPGSYVVQIQGLNKDGLSGSTSLKFEVVAPPSN